MGTLRGHFSIAQMDVDTTLGEYELAPRRGLRIVGHKGPELEYISSHWTPQQMATGVRDMTRHLAVATAGGVDAWMRERSEAAHQAMMQHARRGGIPYN